MSGRCISTSSFTDSAAAASGTTTRPSRRQTTALPTRSQPITTNRSRSARRREAPLESARDHPDLAEHLPRVETLCATVTDLASVKDASVDRILCNELWNDLPTKLMLRKEGEVEEEYLRPNLSPSTWLRAGESKPAVSFAEPHAAISDWSSFVRAFDAKDLRALVGFPPFLEDIIWEKDYRRADWKAVPYRRT